MKKTRLLLICSLQFTCLHSTAQQDFIHTREGRPILDRRQFMNNCLASLNKDRNDETAYSICECQADKFDHHFPGKQYRAHTKAGVINMDGLIKEDSLFEKKLQDCFTGSGQTTLLQAEGFGNDFVSNCMKLIQKNTEKTLDSARLSAFCNCQLEMIRNKKISDAEMETLGNPNSLLYYEMIYTCGDPFLEKEGQVRNWSTNSVKDIRGPDADTIRVLALNGMTFLKMKLGSQVQVWLFDTGASDLLINKSMEEILKKEKILSETNYLGTAEYEMANGMVDTCRRYRVNGLQVGKFYVDNVVMAVTEKGKKIIVGKALLNKFSKWFMNNQDNTLILVR